MVNGYSVGIGTGLQATECRLGDRFADDKINCDIMLYLYSDISEKYGLQKAGLSLCRQNVGGRPVPKPTLNTF